MATERRVDLAMDTRDAIEKATTKELFQDENEKPPNPSIVATAKSRDRVLLAIMHWLALCMVSLNMRCSDSRLTTKYRWY